jgi:hypothetical protein
MTEQQERTSRYAKWFFLAVVCVAATVTPVGGLWIAAEGNGQSRGALAVGILCGIVLWLVLVAANRKLKHPGSDALSWTISVSTAAAAVAAPTVPFGSAASIGFSAFLGTFLTGFVVLLLRRPQRVR